jgi:cell wall assembly regulator SMI1
MGPVRPVWWNPSWFPVLHDESGNYRCIDLDPPDDGHAGQVVEFLHTTADRVVVAPSFGEVLARFASDLGAGRYTVEDEMALVRASS